MNVGILTYHRSINYGAYTQALCLQAEISRRTGYNVEIIDYDASVSTKFYKFQILRKSPQRMLYNFKRYRMFQRAWKELPLSSETLISDDLKEIQRFLNGKYDIIIVGSDEVWKINGLRPFPNAYWLPDIRGTKKLAYAVSGRNSIQGLDKQTIENAQRYMREFDYISVRDETTKDMVDSLLPHDKMSMLVCDPTFTHDFAFDKEKGRKIIEEKFSISSKKKDNCHYGLYRRYPE